MRRKSHTEKPYWNSSKTPLIGKAFHFWTDGRTEHTHRLSRNQISYTATCSLLLSSMPCIGYSDFSRVKLSFPISPYSDNDWNEFDILKHSCFDCVFHSLLKLGILQLQIVYNILLEK